MKLTRIACIAALPLALAGCLEVNQHPAWLEGGYAGKIDQLPYMQHFQRDRLAWSAALANRNLYQNEYVRAKPPGMVGAKRLQDIGATPRENTGPLRPNLGAPGPAPAGATPGAMPGQGAAGAAPPVSPAGAVQAAPGRASPAASGAVRPPVSR